MAYNDLMQRYATKQPKDVIGLQNTSFFYYSNKLWNMIQSLFIIEGLPETCDKDFILDWLFKIGYLGAFKKGNNLYILNCGIAGYNIYYKPTKIVVASPVLGNFDKEIGTQAELIYFNRNNGNYTNLISLVTRYSELLSQCDATLNTTLMNSRVTNVFQANNDADVKSLQKMYDDATAGKPAIYLKKGQNNLLDDTKINIFNAKNTFIGNEILDTKRAILSEFLTEIGVNNTNVSKRERLVTDEVNSNNGEVLVNITKWYNTLNECIDKVNSLFDTNISIEINDKIVEVYQQIINENPTTQTEVINNEFD